MCSSDLEKEYLSVIKEIFIGENIREQFPFLMGKYRVDLFFYDLNIVVEIDEKEHQYKTEYDLNRDEEIKTAIIEYLKQEDTIGRAYDFDYSSLMRIIHIREGHLGEGIRMLMQAIEDITWQSPVSYMAA